MKLLCQLSIAKRRNRNVVIIGGFIPYPPLPQPPLSPDITYVCTVADASRYICIGEVLPILNPDA